MGKYVFALVLVFVFSLAVCAGTMRLQLNLDAEGIRLHRQDAYDFVSYDDPRCYNAAGPGEPELPSLRITLALPRNAHITGIHCLRESPLTVGPFNAHPFQGFHILSEERSATVAMKQEIAGRNHWPLQPISRAAAFSMRGYRLLQFCYHPFVYSPAAKSLSFYAQAEITVTYEAGPAATGGHPAMGRLVRQLVRNPDDVDRFYGPLHDKGQSRTGTDMLIVTTSTLRPAVEQYAAFRAGQGISSVIKTVGDIESQYTGDTIQLKIKQCIYDHTQAPHNVTYVLLVGDAGTDAQYSVPDQNIYGSMDGDNTIPGDIFFSCFDDQFDWNANGNNRVGESYSDDADISPDVVIGRLPVRTTGHILDYLAKVDTYLAEAGNPDYTPHLLLSGVELWSSGDAEDKSELMYANYINPYWPDNVKHTLYDSTPGVTVNVASLTDAMEANNNFMHMATHGNVTKWGMESGDCFYAADAMALDNIPGVIATISCIVNAIDPEVNCYYCDPPADPCLGEGLIRNPNGGCVVFVGSSRYGIGDYSHTVHGPSFTYNDGFIHYCLDTPEGVTGEAFTQAKIDLVADATYDSSYRFIHYNLNFCGDPSLRFYLEESYNPLNMHRFFNTRTGGHFFTISQMEADYIQSNLPHFTYEGIKFSVYPPGDFPPSSLPVHRFFNTRTGGHFFTTSTVEYQYILDNLPHYTYEGVKFYVFGTSNPPLGSMGVHRFFNTRSGGHFFTTSGMEADYIRQNVPHFVYEGIKFYVMPPVW